LLRAELDTADARDQTRSGYESFLKLNPVLLQICNDWQMRSLADTQILNDHTDTEYDARVLTRLMKVDEAVLEICADLASHLLRFGVYGSRFTSALDRVFAGDASFVSENLDSYHTVWFQLHEDLLASLGISRGDERGSATG
jgi:hypothetical protein